MKADQYNEIMLQLENARSEIDRIEKLCAAERIKQMCTDEAEHLYPFTFFRRDRDDDYTFSEKIVTTTMKAIDETIQDVPQHVARDLMDVLKRLGCGLIIDLYSSLDRSGTIHSSIRIRRAEKVIRSIDRT